MKTPPPPHLKIYNNVAKFREATKFPQTVLAQRVGINRSTLFKIEQGQIVPSVLIALRLAHFLQTSVHELFTLEETKVLTEEEKFDLEMAELVQKSQEKRRKNGQA
ncbi:MAG TPA: helix-turn-helix domain-containing protein [Patescibacteria group bacterium]